MIEPVKAFDHIVNEDVTEETIAALLRSYIARYPDKKIEYQFGWESDDIVKNEYTLRIYVKG